MKIGHVASERISSWPILDKTMGWEKRKEQKRKRKKKRVLERDYTFSLNFPTIGQVVRGGAGGRVHPHGKGFTKRPDFGSFDKNSKR